MAGGASTDPIRRFVARLARRPGKSAAAVDPFPAPPDPRLPEQRLIDASAHFALIASGDDPSRRTDAAAAGVRTVAPTAPADAGAPVWVRRLADPNGGALESSESVSVLPERPRPPSLGRRPRRP